MPQNIAKLGGKGSFCQSVRAFHVKDGAKFKHGLNRNSYSLLQKLSLPLIIYA